LNCCRKWHQFWKPQRRRLTTTADDDDNNKAVTTESSYQYSDATTGETALHVACRSPPPVRAIRSLLELLPEMAMTENKKTGELPLLFACFHNATLDVLRELVKDHPQSACWQTPNPPPKKEKTGLGRLLNISASSSSAASTTGGAGGETEEPKTALLSLWEGRTTTDTNKKEEHYSTVFWQKAQALLEAISRFRQGETTNSDGNSQ
jgi:hypothetical protein